MAVPFPDPAFQDGVAIVAGGSGDIGNAICLGLARAGSNVALTYRGNKAAADSVVSRIKELGGDVEAEAFQVDLRDFDAVTAVVSRVKTRFGRIHSVVYASGPDLPVEFIARLAPSEFSRIVDTDIKGAFHLVRATLPHLRESGGGALLAVTTTATKKVPVKEILSPLPKVAIEMLFKGIAKEEGRNRIRANSIGPGWIESKLAAEVASHMPKEQFDGMIRAVPLRRMGKPHEVADLAVFLLSSKGSYISGTAIPIDGGLQL